MHLRAEMPAPVMVSRGPRKMELRIARKVAALCGIAGPADGSDDAGRGRAWLSDYRTLTTTEIAIGGPLRELPAEGQHLDGGLFLRDRRRFRHLDGDDVDYMPIPAVTQRDFGPDTKAALVLTGVNKVLEPVAQAISEALADIRKQVDAPILLVAVGQCLLQEVFAAQPILMLHGIQASQIQRALMLPERIVRYAAEVRQPLARVEYGAERSHRHEPRNLEIVYELWNSVVAGADLDQRGRPRRSEPFLRAKPLFGYESNERVAFTGSSGSQERLVSQLRDASESSLTGKLAGSPCSCVLVFGTADGQPLLEVTIPRQRHIELMLADVAPRLAPRLLDEPLVPGQALALPRIDSEMWRHKHLLHRRAALLAHYYSLRAAGWISGMTKFNHRRNRDECAERCAALVDACEELLVGDDPLRDQITAYALSYRQQYDASHGNDSHCYQLLISALNRMVDRAERGETGRANLLEIMSPVLHHLRSTRRAVIAGVSDEPSPKQLTADLDRWWKVTRKLQDELASDEDERRFIDLGYADFLLDDTSKDEDIQDGLDLITEVINSRKKSACKDGRWIAVRQSYITYLWGLRIALQRCVNEKQVPTLAMKIYEIAIELSGHEETLQFLKQRTYGKQASSATYDGAALILLVTLAEAWICAVRSDALPRNYHDNAYKRADQTVRELEKYIKAVRISSDHPVRSTSQLDDYRAALANRTIRQWREYQAT